MKQLSPEALDVLSGHVAIDGAALRITKPLDRKLYVELALDLRTLIRRCGSVEPLPDGSFSESGTDVRTVLVTLEAP
jgi:hypothetical protein